MTTPADGVDRSAGASLRGPLATAIHISFYVLLATSTVRYLTYHGVSGRFVVVTALIVALAALYTLTAVVARRDGAWEPWVVPVLTTWAVLVWFAPSFAWCAFPMFFLCTRAYPSRIAYPVVGVLAVLTSLAFFTFSGRTEWAVLVGPLCTGALIVMAYSQIERDSRERVRLLRQVADTRSRLAETERAAGALAERERLAREIHDTVTQGLTSSLLRLEAADQIWAQADPRTESRAREDVRAATGTLRENLAETRSLVHHLASPHLESQPIDVALLAAARTHHPRAELRVVGTPIAIPAEVTHALLRITQSAVSNIARHANAETVGVTLTYLPDAVALDIFDDGTGFDPAPAGSPSARGGYGLRAMRRRVEQLGGTFTVESAPGDGTVVAAQIPCARGIAE
ncbi:MULTISPECIES: sensor histidine kinase [unclassified Rhodococcus (in: high G+C Gram-positive bacteria)]|uniref:sensor histidine kinase n=1 Tax=unclassified Rhodococcus (in: high G+C Gram-positive bacteria) TaxID=192944 RepID=UPI00163A4DD2|nr:MULTISPECIES: sensor histidine kinase [unclassified Rhodococcus (in: high G+C Gram-positive bacteria)]MBC2643312.1 sensor histidine kinase [Rhodococcus sp. 3A]MBC2891947.1 sensor histidine kinase [Rhodococcus sp. 4CII]